MPLRAGGFVNIMSKSKISYAGVMHGKISHTQMEGSSMTYCVVCHIEPHVRHSFFCKVCVKQQHNKSIVSFA